MTKLNEIVFNKLIAQAEEAKERGLVKLAEDIVGAIGNEPASEKTGYSVAQLHDDVETELWKVAMHVFKYYNVSSVDAQKLQKNIAYAADRIIVQLAAPLDPAEIDNSIEPKVPGEI